MHIVPQDPLTCYLVFVIGALKAIMETPAYFAILVSGAGQEQPIHVQKIPGPW
jgi:hypothetical protein